MADYTADLARAGNIAPTPNNAFASALVRGSFQPSVALADGDTVQLLKLPANHLLTRFLIKPDASVVYDVGFASDDNALVDLASASGSQQEAEADGLVLVAASSSDQNVILTARGAIGTGVTLYYIAEYKAA